MKRFLLSAAVLALLAAPAFAQSSSSSTTETTRTFDTPTPPPPSTTYDSKSVTYSDDGTVRTDSSTEKHVAPDGSTSTTSKVIQQQNQ